MTPHLMNPPLPPSVLRVLRFVAQQYGTTSSEIRGSSSYAQVAAARHLCCYILVRRCCWSLIPAGRFLNRHHTTVLYGVRRVESAISSDQEVSRIVSDCVAAIGVKRVPHSRKQWRPPESRVEFVFNLRTLQVLEVDISPGGNV